MAAIDILIRAIWQGGSDVGRARRDLQELGASGQMGAEGLETVQSASQRTGQSLGTLALRIGAATAALGAISIAARRAFDRLEAGAGLELTAMRFDNLARSINTTGIALRTDLLEATSGMLSSAEAMSLATDLIGLGLVNTREETVRLARIVSELDVDITQLALTLSNQTTRRFDTLGVSIAGFNDKLDTLKETMSDEDAFLMAFLEQAEESIERMGGAADTTAGDIRRLQADWAALNEEIDIFLAKEFGPALALLSGRTGGEFRENSMYKICPKCDRNLPVNSKYFHRDKTKPGGFYTYCKQCRSRRKTPLLTVEERFWDRTDKRGPDDCWEWTAARYSGGYGAFDPGTGMNGAHRYSYELHHGPIPDGYYVLHRCDNPPCVNPSHLWVGTQKDNIRDMVRKGRQDRGESHHMSKLTRKEVREIRKLAVAGKSCPELGEQYGVTDAAIRLIVKRKNWKHVK